MGDLLQSSDIIDVWRREEGNLADMPERWAEGDKTLRTVYALNILDEQDEYPEDIQLALAGLDAHINNVDDVLDSSDLEAKKEVDMMQCSAKGLAQTYSNIPAEMQPEVFSIVNEYLDEVYDIPKEEKRYRVKLEEAETPEEMIKTAKKCYEVRSTVVDGFFDAGAEYFDINGRRDRMREDTRNLMARVQMVKDLYDIDEDLEDDDLGPSATIVALSKDAEEARETIHDVFDEFDYTEEGREDYGDIIDELQPSRSEIDEQVPYVENAMKRYPMNG